jgi:DNA-binding MarR family transcriptional regulator
VTHPTGALSDVVHHRHRLGILTIASEAEQVEFGYLRQALDLTAGNLNRHLAVLEDAGLVAIVKGYAGRRPKTWVRITRRGRKALAGEMAVLEGLVRTHRRATALEQPEPQAGAGHAGSGQAVGGPDGVDDLADHPGELEVLRGEHEGDAQLP